MASGRGTIAMAAFGRSKCSSFLVNVSVFSLNQNQNLVDLPKVAVSVVVNLLDWKLLVSSFFFFLIADRVE